MNVVLSQCMARESVSAQPAWKTWGRHLACQCAGGTPAPLGEEVDVVRHQAVVEEREGETLPGFLEQREEKFKRNRSPQGTFCFSSAGEGPSSGCHDGALDHAELGPGNEKS